MGAIALLIYIVLPSLAIIGILYFLFRWLFENFHNQELIEKQEAELREKLQAAFPDHALQTKDLENELTSEEIDASIAELKNDKT